MHYAYFDFRHTLSDTDRQQLLQQTFERLLTQAAEGSGRSLVRLLRYLRQSDFYSIPCRHHPFPGGNAWHQLETLLHAYLTPPALPPADDSGLSDSYPLWQPQWQQLPPLSIVLTCLLHDIGNTHHPRLHFPDRIMRRHGRKSTYILHDFLRLDLMFDENMAIIHHQHQSPALLRDNTPTEQDFQLILAMPLYHMICCCDALSCRLPMAEADLLRRLPELETRLLSHCAAYGAL